MDGRLLHAAAVAGTLAVAAACGGSGSPSAPAITLTTPSGGAAAYVEVTGLSRDTLNAIDDAALTPGQWADLLRVAVGPDAPAMLGTHTVTGGALRFTPAFPFDPGRQYLVSFDPSRVPGAALDVRPLSASVGLPPAATVPSTTVARVYPSGDTVPENLLRMYVEFSEPMGRRSGIDHLTLLNGAGEEIPGAILPLDYEFWSPDHRRFTIFFDPGRVKEGILPNRELGRPLADTATMTLVVSRDWRDAQGLPLLDEYRRTFRVTEPDTTPIDPASWTIQAPPAGGRDPLVVTFPEPLDHGLLMRALGVTYGGEALGGDAAVEAGDTRWTFTPVSPWRHGSYELLALDILEDLAGNQIGRAFEVDTFERIDRSPEPQSVRRAFEVRR